MKKSVACSGEEGPELCVLPEIYLGRNRLRMALQLLLPKNQRFRVQNEGVQPFRSGKVYALSGSKKDSEGDL